MKEEKTKEVKTEKKKKNIKEINNLQLLKILERAGIKFSMKADTEVDGAYIIFVRKEKIETEDQIFILNRLHFFAGKEAYVKSIKKGMTPYEFAVERAEQYKLEHPKTEEIDYSEEFSDEEDSEDTPF